MAIDVREHAYDFDISLGLSAKPGAMPRFPYKVREWLDMGIAKPSFQERGPEINCTRR